MKRSTSIVRKLLKFALRGAGLCAVVLAIAMLIWLRHALYHHFVTFPSQKAAWEALQAQRQSVPTAAPWKEFRGILHSHSEHSHDSEIPFPQILQAMKVARLDFICLSDHCTDGRADFDLQWRGLHEGRLFVPGFEMRDGIMPFGVRPGVVLSNRTDPAILAKQVIQNGGVLFYAHPEEPRVWERPELTGMEIYNIHADFKAQKNFLSGLLPEVLVNQSEYPEQMLRLIFRRPTEFLKHWDELNRTRHLTGISGNDCHQNVGIRAVYTTNGTIRVEDTSPKKISEFKLNWATRPIARLWFGPLNPGQKLFHAQLDPYERMARFVNTHLLTRELSEAAILDALRVGRGYVGFDMVADSSGFGWQAENSRGKAVMGETLAHAPSTRLRATSPLSCRFTILKDGNRVHEQEGRSVEWVATAPGKYRVEAELKIVDEWTPWVYTNPIELR